jgi:hypothetical protein
MNKARDIKRDKIREERKPLFEQLDVMFMRAIEAGDEEKKAEVASLKQALRDAPEDISIDLTTTIDDLRQLDINALIVANTYILNTKGEKP